MMRTRHGHFHWNELITDDVEAAKRFFAETVGWHFDAFPMANEDIYWVCMARKKAVGGIMDARSVHREGLPPTWFAYLAVDDVDKCVARVAEAGGVVLREPFDVPVVGRIAMVRDASGAEMGWITPVKQDRR